MADRLIFVESRDGDVRISGCAAHPSQSRSNNRMQYLFLNGRHIRDHALQHALAEAYRGLLMVGRYAIAFLSIEMPPDMVDVNVHPTKLEVRFRDGGRLYSQLLSTLRSKFLTTDLTTQAQAPPGQRGSQRRARRDAGGPVAARAGRLGQGQGRCLAAAGQAAEPSQPAAAPEPAADEPWARSEPLKQYSFPTSDPAAQRRPLELTRLDLLRPAFQPPAGRDAGRGARRHATREMRQANRRGRRRGTCLGASAPGLANPQSLSRHRDAGGRDDHRSARPARADPLRAASARIDAGALETQNLLVPEPVDLSPAEAAIALEHRDVLGQLGLRIEPFGGDTVLITGFPAMLANMNPGEILHALLERLVSGGGQPDRRDLLDDMLHTVACKAAIKAGDRLTAAEIAALLGAAAHGRRLAPLPSRPAHGTGFHAGGVG